MLLAQVEVVVENFPDLVEATRSLSAADLVAAGAAVASAFLAAVLVYVTSQYTRATNAIKDANEAMATANAQMAESSAAVLLEMQEDRREAKAQRSRDAAQRVSFGLADARKHGITGATPEAVQASAREGWEVWAASYRRDVFTIQPAGLREDVQRFAELYRVLAFEFAQVVEAAAVDQRSVPASAYRFAWAGDKLLQLLGSHQRGEPDVTPQLPANAWDFLMLKRGVSRMEFYRLADCDADISDLLD
jgi:hypothetical protein